MVDEKTRIVRLTHKVFCIGLNKTGTTSFGTALEWFGYHKFGWRGGQTGESHQLIMDYFAGRKESLIYAAYKHNVMEDIPWPLMFREFEEHFPNAKFVLTVRKTPEIWLDSIQRHITNDYVGHRLIYGHSMPKKNPQAYLDKYNTHNAEVVDYFADKPGKLLKMCFEEGDGWGKLLPFLGLKGTPVADFPHRNKGRKNQGTGLADKEKASTRKPQQNRRL